MGNEACVPDPSVIERFVNVTFPGPVSIIHSVSRFRFWNE